MSQVTRCPECKTTFRVSPAQLSARGGRVRCGKCSAAFDGVAQLLTEEAAAKLAEESSASNNALEGVKPFDRSVVERPADTGVAMSDAIEPDVAHPMSSGNGGLPNDTYRDSVESALPGPPPKIVVPAFLAPQQPRVAHALLWTLLSIGVLAGLVLQAVLHFRTEIAVVLPSTRIHLESACAKLGCEVKLPRRADLMSIESSDLQADSQRPGVIVLNALLRNRAPFAQEYPDLELTLTDQGDRPVIRRVLGADSYLQEKRAAVSQGIAGGAEETVRIYLDTSGIPATGYQLFLFYACPLPASSGFWQLSYPSRCEDSRNK